MRKLTLLFTLLTFSLIGEASWRYRNNGSFQRSRNQAIQSHNNLIRAWINANTTYRYRTKYLRLYNKSSYPMRAYYWTSNHDWLSILLAPGDLKYARDTKGRKIHASYFLFEARSIDGRYSWAQQSLSIRSYVDRNRRRYTYSFTN